MKPILISALLLFSMPAFAQKGRKAANIDKQPKTERVEHVIRQIMQAQEAAWNRGDLEGFMDGYWHSDSLRFIGASGLTFGWQQTLNNYKKAYPDRDAMGKLTFTILSVEKLALKTAYVIGKWRISRKNGDRSGYYTLLWKKIKGKWVIVTDHSD